MNRFFVGQRVRKIAHSGKDSDVVPLNSIGTVIEVDKPARDNFNPIFVWVVYDNSPSLHRTLSFAQLQKNIEPVDDSNDKTSWSECAWKPSHLRESA